MVTFLFKHFVYKIHCIVFLLVYYACIDLGRPDFAVT